MRPRSQRQLHRDPVAAIENPQSSRASWWPLNVNFSSFTRWRSRNEPLGHVGSGIARSAAVVARLVLTAVPLTLSVGCGEKLEPIVSDYTENFDRQAIGPTWRDSGGGYRIVNGELTTSGAHHHPIWLRKRLPRDISMEFDVRTTSPDGDIRFVIFGDGKSANPDGDGCQSSGYELVFGGWKNHVSVLCREHQQSGGHQGVRTDWPVVPGRTYHNYITRKDGIIAWYIDGHDMMSWTDPQPLAGKGHEAFGFDGGETEVFFDNLVVGPYHI
jgi:hypothetical protein